VKQSNRKNVYKYNCVLKGKTNLQKLCLLAQTARLSYTTETAFSKVWFSGCSTLSWFVVENYGNLGQCIKREWCSECCFFYGTKWYHWKSSHSLKYSLYQNSKYIHRTGKFKMAC